VGLGSEVGSGEESTGGVLVAGGLAGCALVPSLSWLLSEPMPKSATTTAAGMITRFFCQIGFLAGAV
jgi:hypothetical protein